ncbi:MAG: hypothetical protein RL637_55 [Pseudomonadota bacterium]
MIIMIFTYAAILFSVASSLLALFYNHREWLYHLVQMLSITNSSNYLTYFETEQFPRIWMRIVYFCLTLAGISAIIAGSCQLISSSIMIDQIHLGLPWLPWHVHFDYLSAFFYLMIGIAVTIVSIYTPDYIHHYDPEQYPLSLLGLFTGLFIAGMLLVLIADDAFFFMIAWELMSVASYFLVAFQHEHSANRRAAFLYLLMAEVGALMIILAFGVLASFSDSFTFDQLREAKLSDTWATIAFVLALIGFGMKAGLVPLHVWLPEAHPVAPSHISALMSGIMLKVALYGLIRFSLDLIPTLHWQWGLILMILGVISALVGILYAMMQPNLKRLLAYSSVENMGIMMMVLGLTIIFQANGYPQLAALGLVATLLHAFNHALFKSLLFLIAGIIHQQTHQLNINLLGGLIHKMPKTSAIFLIGCMSISSLPLFNGFVSEWLVFQTALQVDVLENGVLRSLIPVAAAGLALTAALAAACFVKVFGIIFLGLPHSRYSEKAVEVETPFMLIAPGILAGLCILFGIFPSLIIQTIQPITQELIGSTLPKTAILGWIWLAPVAPQKASYAAPLVLISVIIASGIIYAYLKRNPDTFIRRSETWDCGFGGLNARMQYNSESFTMPFRRIFSPIWIIEEHIEKQQVGALNQQVIAVNYHLKIEDHIWFKLYQPIQQTINKLAKQVSKIQTGHLRTYLGYSFVTLILLLWVVSL